MFVNCMGSVSSKGSKLFVRHTIVTWLKQASARGLLTHNACWIEASIMLAGGHEIVRVGQSDSNSLRMPLSACSVQEMAMYRQYTRFAYSVHAKRSACNCSCVLSPIAGGNLTMCVRLPSTRGHRQHVGQSRTAQLLHSAGNSLSS